MFASSPSHTPSTDASSVRPLLTLGGRVVDAGGRPAAVALQLTIVLEAVVADDTDPLVHDAYGVELRSGHDGRFADGFDVPDDVRERLIGWVKCTVQLMVRAPAAPIHTRVVRWMRPTSAAVIEGLSALLAGITVTCDSLDEK